MSYRPLRFLSGLPHHVDRMNRGGHPIYLDYPISPAARYGWGRPTHCGLTELLERNRARYVALIDGLAECGAGLSAIPVHAASAEAPYWQNGYLQDLDAAMAYAIPKLFGSRRYVEIGSGNSTKFVRQSVADHSLDLRIVSIDPSPRSEIDELCDAIERVGLEDAPLEIFGTLEANDVLFIDGSHRCFQNSDVTVVFMEILPYLEPGVLVYFDDVFLPADYPPEWSRRHYSEQYLLAVLLLTDRQRRYEVLFPASFSFMDEALRSITDRFWADLDIAGFTRTAPNGFWLRVK
jgi:predicted O-methyltransferase YrrM